MIKQVSEGESRNVMWSKRRKAGLVLIFGANANCENMAYPCLRSFDVFRRAMFVGERVSE